MTVTTVTFTAVILTNVRIPHKHNDLFRRPRQGVRRLFSTSIMSREGHLRNRYILFISHH
jgi:hypothetical protein